MTFIRLYRMYYNQLRFDPISLSIFLWIADEFQKSGKPVYFSVNAYSQKIGKGWRLVKGSVDKLINLKLIEKHQNGYYTSVVEQSLEISASVTQHKTSVTQHKTSVVQHNRAPGNLSSQKDSKVPNKRKEYGIHQPTARYIPDWLIPIYQKWLDGVGVDIQVLNSACEGMEPKEIELIIRCWKHLYQKGSVGIGLLIDRLRRRARFPDIERYLFSEGKIIEIEKKRAKESLDSQERNEMVFQIRHKILMELEKKPEYQKAKKRVEREISQSGSPVLVHINQTRGNVLKAYIQGVLEKEFGVETKIKEAMEV